MGKRSCYVMENNKPCTNPVTHKRKTIATTVFMCRKHARQWNKQLQSKSPPRVTGQVVSRSPKGRRAVVVEG